MNFLAHILYRTPRTRPLNIELDDSPEHIAAALHGLAHLVHRRRHDLVGQSIRITVTVRDPYQRGRR